MLAINNIEVVYDGVILVLKGVSLFAEEGRITTLLIIFNQPSPY